MILRYGGVEVGFFFSLTRPKARITPVTIAEQQHINDTFCPAPKRNSCGCNVNTADCKSYIDFRDPPRERRDSTICGASAFYDEQTSYNYYMTSTTRVLNRCRTILRTTKSVTRRISTVSQTIDNTIFPLNNIPSGIRCFCYMLTVTVLFIHTNAVNEWDVLETNRRAEWISLKTTPLVVTSVLSFTHLVLVFPFLISPCRLRHWRSRRDSVCTYGPSVQHTRYLITTGPEWWLKKVIVFFFSSWKQVLQSLFPTLFLLFFPCTY